MKAEFSNGIWLEYEERGDKKGEPLIMIRGLGTQLIDWPDSLLDGLVDKGFRVVVFDNRDAGLSSHFDARGLPDMKAIAGGSVENIAYHLEDMAKDVIGLMDALAISRACLFGISMGGMIAQLLASGFPDRCNRLISVMSSSGRKGLPGPSAEAQRALMREANSDESMEAIVRRIAEDAAVYGSPAYPESLEVRVETARKRVERRFAPDGVARQMAAVVANGSREDLLSKISVPTLVIHGDADPLIPCEAGKDTARCIPGARLEIITGMGHNLPEQLVPKYVELICEHCLSASPAG